MGAGNGSITMFKVESRDEIEAGWKGLEFWNGKGLRVGC